MNAPHPDEVAAELLADDQFLTDLSEEFRDQHDRLRKDLRRLVGVPAGQYVTDAELIAQVGLAYMYAETVLRGRLTEGGAQ